MIHFHGIRLGTCREYRPHTKIVGAVPLCPDRLLHRLSRNPDDPLISKPLPRLFDLHIALSYMNAVRMDPGGNLYIIVNDKRYMVFFTKLLDFLRLF